MIKISVYMETKLKIQKIWTYLEVQDDERLIVRKYESETGKDVYIVAEMKDGDLTIAKLDNIPDAINNQSFILIQQRDDSGKYIIPSVQQMMEDKSQDY